MSNVPFYLTGMGRRFYERTVPDIARELARLNDNLERLLSAGFPASPTDDPEPQAHGEPKVPPR